MKLLLLLAVLFACSASPISAQSTIFLIRHAEKTTDAGVDAKDPDLSKEGRARAESLAMMLKDAGLTAVYVTEFKRTRQTAEPVARAAGVKITSIAARDGEALVAKLREAPGVALVVGHANTVPDIIRAFGITVPVAIADGDYDNLFVVTGGASPHLVRLHYR